MRQLKCVEHPSSYWCTVIQGAAFDKATFASVMSRDSIFTHGLKSKLWLNNAPHDDIIAKQQMAACG